MHLLDPHEDFELWFWAAMVGGTNAVNAALHHAGLTPGECAYPSQPGVYFIPGVEGYTQVAGKVGDVLHVGRPAVEGPIPPQVKVMMDAMEVIEAYRDPCTRGDMQITAEVIEHCQEAYRTCITQMQKYLPKTEGAQ